MTEYKQVGRLVLRGGANGAFADFTSYVNIPNLQLDNDEMVYVRVESISNVQVLDADIAGRFGHINVVCPSIPQPCSYDTGINNAASLCQPGTCQCLLQLSWLNTIGSYRIYGARVLPKIPLKVVANLLQGKYIRIRLEYSDGSPILPSSLNASDNHSIIFGIYK